MIKRIIGKLRRQPKSVREGIAFWSASGFAFVIFSVWLLSVPARFSDMVLVTKDDEVGPAKSFFEGITDQVATVKEALPNAETAPSSSSEGSLSDLVNQFRGQSSSSASTKVSSQSSSNSTNVTTPTKESEAGSPQERFVQIVTTSSTSATSSVGR